MQSCPQPPSHPHPHSSSHFPNPCFLPPILLVIRPLVVLSLGLEFSGLMKPAWTPHLSQEEVWLSTLCTHWVISLCTTLKNKRKNGHSYLMNHFLRARDTHTRKKRQIHKNSWNKGNKSSVSCKRHISSFCSCGDCSNARAFPPKTPLNSSGQKVRKSWPKLPCVHNL